MASGRLVVAALVVLNCADLESQKIHILPPISYAVAGGNVTLTCSHYLGSNATVSWKRGTIGENVELFDSTVIFSGSSIVITQFNASRHVDYYTCSVQGLQKETIISCPAEVTLAYADFGRVKHPKDTITTVGSSAVLHCNVKDSVPRVQVSWTHNSHSLDLMTDTGISILPSGNLFIPHVDATSRGSYRCIATNSITLTSWRSEEAILTVLDAGAGNSTIPTFIVEPEDTEAMEGSTAVLECAGQGNPKPIVKWEKFDMNSASSQSLPDGASMHTSGALIISNVSRIHTGTYVCKLLFGDVVLRQRRVNLTITGVPDIEQAFAFTDENGMSGLVCTSGVSSLSEGDCQQDLYLLYNGTIIGQAKGDTRASLVHFFHSFPEVNSSRMFQCVSISPGGCTIKDIQANFVDGIITDKIIMDSPFENSGASLCEASLPTKDTETAPSTDDSQTILMQETTSSSCEYTSQEPGLEVSIQHTVTCASVGSTATSTCEVTGPESGSIIVTWLYNGTRDLLAQPVENISVNIQSSKFDSASRITADLVISGINYGHAGIYMCSAHSECPVMHASSSITFSVESTKVTAPPPSTMSMTAATMESVQTTLTEEVIPVTEATEKDATSSSTPSLSTLSSSIPSPSSSAPPLSFTPSSRPLNKPTHLPSIVFSIISKDIHLTWTYSGHEFISGFKINWDTPDRITKSARHSVEANTLEFIIPSSSYDSSNELVIYVWAYNEQGDGPYSLLRIDPAIEDATDALTTATTSVATHPTLNTILQCSATAINATSLELAWPASLKIGSPSIVLISICEEGNIMRSTSLHSSASPYVLNRVLPNCSYTFELQSALHIAVCKTFTPIGQVDIEVNVTRLPNGSSAVHLLLPPEIHDEEDLQVEVNFGEGWLMLNEFHIPGHFDSSKEHQIEIRLRLGGWKGYTNITVPAMFGDMEREKGQRTADVVLTYVIIFATLLITCVILLAIVLGLKYLQWSHREQDKTTDFREKSRQYFPERDEKSSLKSDISDNSTAV